MVLGDGVKRSSGTESSFPQGGGLVNLKLFLVLGRRQVLSCVPVLGYHSPSTSWWFSLALSNSRLVFCGCNSFGFCEKLRKCLPPDMAKHHPDAGSVQVKELTL